MLIAGLAAALALLPRPGLALLAGALAAAGGFEWARLCGLGAVGAAGYAAAIALGVLAAYHTEPLAPLFALAAAFWLLVAPLWLWRGVARAGLAAAGFFVLLPAALALLALRPAEVFLVLALVWIADSAAYFAGRRWGRRKLAPAISPGKTWEGAAAGLAAVLAYAIICGIFVPGVAWVPFLAAAALLAAVSIVGDLFESAVKRQAGVKDSGTILPGHGGILDRIDSATAVLPLAALLWPWLKGTT